MYVSAKRETPSTSTTGLGQKTCRDNDVILFFIVLEYSTTGAATLSVGGWAVCVCYQEAR